MLFKKLMYQVILLVIVFITIFNSAESVFAADHAVSSAIHFTETNSGLPVQNATLVIPANGCAYTSGGSYENLCASLVSQYWSVTNGIATLAGSYRSRTTDVTGVSFVVTLSPQLRGGPPNNTVANLPAITVTKAYGTNYVTFRPDSFIVTGFDSAQPPNPTPTPTPSGTGGITPQPTGSGGTTPPAGGGGGGSGAVPIPTIMPTQPPNTVPDINTFVSKLYTFGISLAGVVFVIMFLIGGLQYLTTAGNEESTGKAKRLMVDAIIGLVLTLGAYAIAKFIGVELGIF